MGFEVKVGMKNAEIIELAKRSGVPDEIIEKLNSVMANDTNDEISSPVEQYMVQSILDCGSIFVNKAVAGRVQPIENGYTIEDSIGSRSNKIHRKNIYYKNEEGNPKFSQTIMTSRAKDGTVHKIISDVNNQARTYVEEKDGKVTRQIDFDS